MKIHMQFSHPINNSGSPSKSGPVFVVIIHSDPMYFQTGWDYKAFLEHNMTDFLADVPLISH
jgi:hypothetical protein